MIRMYLKNPDWDMDVPKPSVKCPLDWSSEMHEAACTVANQAMVDTLAEVLDGEYCDLRIVDDKAVLFRGEEPASCEHIRSNLPDGEWFFVFKGGYAEDWDEAFRPWAKCEPQDDFTRGAVHVPLIVTVESGRACITLNDV